MTWLLCCVVMVTVLCCQGCVWLSWLPCCVVRGVRDDIEQEDVEEAYYRYMEENPMAGILAEEAEELNVEYDNDGNIIYVEKNKVTITTRIHVVYIVSA